LTIRDTIIELARDEANSRTPYIWGGQTLGKGVDCSGLVVAILRKLSLVAPTWDDTAQGMYSRCQGRLLHELQPGDLIFYGHPDPAPLSLGYHVGHVAIYSGRDPGKIHRVIHARGGDSRCTSAKIAKSMHAYVQETSMWLHTGFLGAGAISSLTHP
jgi:cell wall-associated NlpC family hydrolase